ncbi:MAG: CpaE-like family protein [Actinomycetia bacterium]|nr:CpaE-like family protein [Actinomycetes bacterium]
MTFSPVPARPLVVASDPTMLDEVLRLCAAAGVTPEVASDAGQARRSWSTAPCIVVDAAQAPSLAGSTDRRDGVVIVSAGPVESGDWENAVAIGAEVVVALPDDEAVVVEALSASAEADSLDGSVLCVVGGTGGSGASTFAVGLALTAARDGGGAMLVDADPLGRGLDLMVGAEDVNGVRWHDLASTQGRVSGASLRQVLPRSAGLSVLSYGRPDTEEISADSMRSVLAAGRRSHDAVVVDLPRYFDDASREALSRATSTVLLVPAEISAIASAQRVLARLHASCADIHLVVRRPGPSGLSLDTVASTMALPLAASVRTERKIAEFVDNGLGPLARGRTSLGRACSSVLATTGVLDRAAA